MKTSPDMPTIQATSAPPIPEAESQFIASWRAQLSGDALKTFDEGLSELSAARESMVKSETVKSLMSAFFKRGELLIKSALQAGNANSEIASMTMRENENAAIAKQIMQIYQDIDHTNDLQAYIKDMPPAGSSYIASIRQQLTPSEWNLFDSALQQCEKLLVGSIQPGATLASDGAMFDQERNRIKLALRASPINSEIENASAREAANLEIAHIIISLYTSRIAYHQPGTAIGSSSAL